MTWVINTSVNYILFSKIGHYEFHLEIFMSKVKIKTFLIWDLLASNLLCLSAELIQTYHLNFPPIQNKISIIALSHYYILFAK